jgi:hypothetical protein
MTLAWFGVCGLSLVCRMSQKKYQKLKIKGQKLHSKIQKWLTAERF